MSQSRENNMKLTLEGSILKGLFFLAIPILIGNLLQSAYQFTDAYWVGKLGKEAVAAVSVSGPIIFLIVALGTGFAIAGSILISQYAGAKNTKMVNFTATQTLITITLVGILLGILGYFNTGNILNLMRVDPSVIIHTKPFMQIAFISLVFAFIFSMFQSILRGIGEVKIPMYIILGTVILNAFIDPLFIFGYGPIPAMGVQGAAIASMITQGISAIIGLIILFRGNYGIKLIPKEFKSDFSFIKKLFFLGLPASLDMSLRAVGMLVMMTLVTSFGTIALASYGAGGNIFQLVFIPTMGLSVATSTMVAQNLGAGQLDRAGKIAKISAITAFIALEIIGIFVSIFAPELIGIFIHNEPQVLKMGAEFLRTFALSLGFMGIQFSLTGVFRAAGNMVLAMMLGIISVFVIQFPIAFILSKYTSLGIDGVWWAFPIVNVVLAIICTLIYLKGDWKKKKIT